MTGLVSVWIIIATCLICFANSVAISGVSGGVDQITGQRPFRQELSSLKASGPAFDLYILSLQQFQQQNQTTLLSYYQVAGIHGHPYNSWDGVQGQYSSGYCTHGSILFPMWHRPYLALFEQILWGNAQTTAAAYPVSQRSQYQAAAKTFRIPYWDWAFNATMPDLVNQPTININTPHGALNMLNPLYNYTFHPQPSAADFPPSDSLAKLHSTARSPDANGLSQPQMSNQQLEANAQALHDLTYQLIAGQSNYAPFSNTGYTDGRGGSYNSIENMHNAIHSFVGNGGHMTYVPYSAFDPIFWLHHANVDRLIAIWQAIYPDSFTTSEINAEGTYTDAPGKAEDINTPLTPFHSNNAGTLYTSATARKTLTFGYSYPEVVDWAVSTTQLSSNVRAELNALYNPTGSIAQRSLESSNHTNSSTSYQYFVNIRVDKSALHAPFYIHFFLCPPPTDPNSWATAPNLIASHSILYTNPISMTTYGQIPLNHALARSYPTTASSPAPEAILPLLKKELNWRVQTFDGGVVDAAAKAMQSLRIFVVGRSVRENYTVRDQLPVYGAWELWRGVTEGKVGGLGAGEGM